MRRSGWLAWVPDRWAFASIRSRILVGFVGMLAFATVGSVLVAREVLYNRLDERINRAIGVHPAYIRAALEKVYDAKALLAEIDAK